MGTSRLGPIVARIAWKTAWRYARRERLGIRDLHAFPQMSYILQAATKCRVLRELANLKKNYPTWIQARLHRKALEGK